METPAKLSGALTHPTHTQEGGGDTLTCRPPSRQLEEEKQGEEKGEQRAPAAILHFLRAGETQGRRQVNTYREEAGPAHSSGPQSRQEGSGLATVPSRSTDFPTAHYADGRGATTLTPRKPSQPFGNFPSLLCPQDQTLPASAQGPRPCLHESQATRPGTQGPDSGPSP